MRSPRVKFAEVAVQPVQAEPEAYERIGEERTF